MNEHTSGISEDSFADDLPAHSVCERVRFRNRDGDRLIENDVIVTTPEIWATLPQADSPSWQSIEVGPVVIALRCVA
jgi:hypothetical protein